MTACIGEPISWLRLERFALGVPDPSIASHIAACPACRQCLDQIHDDAIALPPLDLPIAVSVALPAALPTGVPAAVPAAPPRPARRRRWLAPAFAMAAAAIVLIVVLARPTPRGDEEELATRVAIGIKGLGEITLELVRERGGAISFDARSFAPGDRWKVVLSCPPGASAGTMWIDVTVADGLTTDHPLAPAQLACGNRVVVPGAFTVTGIRANRVCARVAAGPDADAGTACLTLRPE
jgi:hypothetical protein